MKLSALVTTLAFLDICKTNNVHTRDINRSCTGRPRFAQNFHLNAIRRFSHPALPRLLDHSHQHSFLQAELKTKEVSEEGNYSIPKPLEKLHKEVLSSSSYTYIVAKGSRTFYLLGKDVQVSNKFLCENRANKRLDRTIGGCYCDGNCVFFGDCCIDAFGKNMAEFEKMIYQSNFTASTLTKLEQALIMHGQCRTTILENATANFGSTYIMISSCPENPKPKHKTLCEQDSHGLLRNTPVSTLSSERVQTVFKNVFCAFCHCINRNELTFWNPQHTCTSKTGQNSGRRCWTIMIPPSDMSSRPRVCIDDTFWTSCKNESSMVKETNTTAFACEKYIAPVLLNTKTFRNPHCTVCMNMKQTTSTFPLGKPQTTVYSSTRKPPIQGIVPTALPVDNSGKPIDLEFLETKVQGLVPLDLTVLFRIDSSLSSTFDNYIEPVCGIGEHYILGTCRPINCRTGMVFLEGKCQRDGSWITLDNKNLLPSSTDIFSGYILEIALVGFQYWDAEDIKSYVISVIDEDIKTNNVSVLFTNVSIVGRQQLTANNGDLLLYFNLTFTLNIVSGALPPLLQGLSKVRSLGTNFIKLLSVTIANFISTQTFTCAKTRALHVFRNFSLIAKEDDLFVISRKHKRQFLLESTVYFLVLDKIGKYYADFLHVCLSTIKCPTTHLNESEYILTNNSVYVIKLNKTIEPGHYEIKNSSLNVCEDDLKGKKTFAFVYDPRYRLASVIVCVISVIALVLTIIIYLVSKPLHTMHAKNLLSLSATLILAQSLLLSQSTDNATLCLFIAASVHFSWLSSFTWMSVISYDMVITFFFKPLTVKYTDNNIQYCKHAVIAWLFPLSIVCTCVGLDRTASHVEIGYGMKGYCFIGNGMAMVVAFFVPIGSCLIFNFTTFCLTVYGMRRGRQKRHWNVGKKLNPVYSVVYLKLSVLMGLTWTFAILAAVMRESVFWFLYISVNGLHGMLIFVCFILNSRIFSARKPNFLTSSTVS